MTPAEFLLDVESARADWDSLVAQVETTLPVDIPFDSWSLKDTIAHVTWFEREMIGILRTHALVGSDWWNLPADERNAHIFEANRTRAYAAIRAESQGVYRELVRLLQTLDASDLNDPTRFQGFPDDWVPWKLLAENTFEHYSAHATTLRVWLMRHNQMPPIAIQLYTVREQLATDFEGVIRRIAADGYVGVETAGQFGESVASAAKLFQQLGLQVTSAHVPSPYADNIDAGIANAKTLGTKRLVCAWYPPERLKTREGIREMCQEINRGNEKIHAAGLELLYHNHWAEAYLVDGKYVYEHMLEFLDPTVGFEVDVYWAKTAGADPAAMLRELGKRAPLLHIKDGPATMDGDMTAVGEGVMDLSAIAEASKDTAEWWIVELDRCATDMLQAVDKSYTYLTENGFAYGK